MRSVERGIGPIATSIMNELFQLWPDALRCRILKFLPRTCTKSHTENSNLGSNFKLNPETRLFLRMHCESGPKLALSLSGLTQCELA